MEYWINMRIGSQLPTLKGVEIQNKVYLSGYDLGGVVE